MQVAEELIQKFINLCEIPAIYTGIALDSLTIDIDLIEVYDQRNSVRVIVNCDRLPLARDIGSHHEVFRDVMQMLKVALIKINFRGQYFLECVNESFLTQPINSPESMNNTDIDLNSLYNSSNPVYLIDMNSETLLFANPTACVDNQKPADKFLGENIAVLNYPDELEKRKRLLRQDGKLTNYEYKAMNWYKDGEIWRRREMNLVADIQKIEFFGCECRLGIDLMVEETRRFVD